jgi:hypothetical protein
MNIFLNACCSIIFFLIYSTSAFSVPKYLEIREPSGVAVRKSTDTSSDVVSAAYYQYHYPIIDVQATFIQIRLLDGKTGWSYLGKKNERFSIENNHATNRVDYAIPVKTKDGILVGAVEPNETVPIIDTWYGRAKLRTPNGNGWIYTGNLTEQNVLFLDTPPVTATFYADFSESHILSNMPVDLKQSEFFEPANAYRLYANNDSEIELKFDVGNQKNARIVLEHQSKDSDDHSAYSPIRIHINDRLIVSEFQPASGVFAIDQFLVSGLKPGENTITLRLTSGSTHYWIRSFRIYLDPA